MSLKLDNLAAFYREKMEQSAQLPASLDHWIVYYALLTFTVAGFFTIFGRLSQLARLMLSLFVLPGKSVNFSVPGKLMFYQAKVAIPAPHIWPALQNMGTGNGGFGWHRQGVCPSVISCRLLHPACIPHRQQARCFGGRDQVKIQYPHQNLGHGFCRQ